MASRSPISTSDPQLDLTVDGADEIDPEFRLIKGGGGALLREKIVASSSRMMMVIADESKRVERLGKFPLPVEVVPFGVKATAFKIERAFTHLKLDATMVVAACSDGKPFVTDNGNLILDCAIGEIPEPAKAGTLCCKASRASSKHGLFIGICGIVLMGTPKGVIEFKRG